jgi:hypothetical protein
LDISNPIGSDVPNGFAGNACPPLVTCFPVGRSATLYEQGASVNLVQWGAVPASVGTWIADGTTLIVEGPTIFKILVINIPPAIPPAEIVQDSYNKIYNLWVVDNGIHYGFKFSGSVTYYTTDP